MRFNFNCTNPACGVELAIDEANLNPANPKVRCSNCNRVIDLAGMVKKEKQQGDPGARVDIDEPIAWLLVHDENASQQVFALKAGKHIVGRKSESKPCNVMIESEHDPYMSRNHCAIEVRRNTKGLVEVLLSDNKSTNGTWLNAEEKIVLKPGEKIFLEDNDMLQLGMTKVIVKIKQGKIKSIGDAATEVFKKPFGKTRIIDT